MNTEAEKEPGLETETGRNEGQCTIVTDSLTFEKVVRGQTLKEVISLKVDPTPRSVQNWQTLQYAP